ncbi:MAG: hypothetical protein AAF458_22905 [Pseudomonadota bacterium]
MIADVREYALVLLAALLLSALTQWSFDDPFYPQQDATRYIDYALNLHDHGVFGLSGTPAAPAPPPGNANMPGYPAWLALVMWLDPDVEASLRCIGSEAPGTFGCKLDLATLWWLQALLLTIVIVSVYFAARTIWKGRLPAWIAAVSVTLSGDLIYYANRAQTEALTVPAFALGSVLLMCAWRRRSGALAVAAGIAFGLTGMVRPGMEYAVICVALTTAVVAFWQWRPARLKLGLWVVLGFALVMMPWSARNLVQIGSAQLTSGYGGLVLAQRVVYNHMSDAEWRASFIFWLPDFGDSLARDLFPESSYVRLGLGPDTYFTVDGPALYARAVERAGGPDAVAGYLIRTEVLGAPVNHVLTSIPLTLRGMFPGDYWGLLGGVCLVIVLAATLARREPAVLVMALPGLWLLAFYAGISINIPRYNITLIPVYALAIGGALGAFRSGGLTGPPDEAGA